MSMQKNHFGFIEKETLTKKEFRQLNSISLKKVCDHKSREFSRITVVNHLIALAIIDKQNKLGLRLIGSVVYGRPESVRKGMRILFNSINLN